MNVLIIIASLAFFISCGKSPLKSNEQELLFFQESTESLLEIEGMHIEYFHREGSLASGERSVFNLGKMEEGRPYSPYLLERIYFEYHHLGLENHFYQLNRLQPGIVLTMSHSLSFSLEGARRFDRAQFQIRLNGYKSSQRYELTWVHRETLKVSDVRIPLKQLRGSRFESNIIEQSIIERYAQGDYQLMLTWRDKNARGLTLHIVDEERHQSIKLHSADPRELHYYFSSNDRVAYLDEYTQREDIIEGELDEPFWICYPCNESAIGGFGQAFLIKTSLRSILKAHRSNNVELKRFSFNSRSPEFTIQSLDRVNFTITPIIEEPRARLVMRHPGVNRGDCFSLVNEIQYTEVQDRDAEAYLREVYLETRQGMRSLHELLVLHGERLYKHNDGSLSFGLEFEETKNDQAVLVSWARVDEIELNFLAEEEHCQNRVRQLSPERTGSARERVSFSVEVSIDGLERRP